jgi:hypothetical protein
MRDERNEEMSRIITICTLALGLTGMLAVSAAVPGMAAPGALSAAVTKATPTDVSAVQWRRGWRGSWHRGGGPRHAWRRGDRGIAFGAGLAAGALFGAALARPDYDDYGPGGAYAYEPEVAYAPDRCWNRTDDRGFGYWGFCRPGPNPSLRSQRDNPAH